MMLEINVKRNFRECICIKSNSNIFKVGHIYPICGDNNGLHVIGINSEGDPYDLLCFNYGGIGGCYDDIIGPADSEKENDIAFTEVF